MPPKDLTTVPAPKTRRTAAEIAQDVALKAKQTAEAEYTRDLLGIERLASRMGDLAGKAYSVRETERAARYLVLADDLTAIGARVREGE